MKRVKLHYSAFQSYTAEGPRANEKGATVLVHTDNLAARIDNAVRDMLAKALGGG